jgi:hypothetical protein
MPTLIGIIPNVYELKAKQPYAQIKITLLLEDFLGDSEDVNTTISTVKIYNDSTGEDKTPSMLIDESYNSATKQWNIIYGGGVHNNKYKIEVQVVTNASPAQKEEITIFFEVYDK